MRDINSGQVLGFITQGSLSDGLEVRLYPDISVDDMRVGKFLIVQGVLKRFFCMLTDVTLGSASARIVANPPVADDDFLTQILHLEILMSKPRLRARGIKRSISSKRRDTTI